VANRRFRARAFRKFQKTAARDIGPPARSCHAADAVRGPARHKLGNCSVPLRNCCNCLLLA